MSWNGFCMIRVGEQLPDGLTREVRSLRWSVMVKWPPTPPKIEKNKFVLKCILGHFQYFEPMFFLVENWLIRTPPPLSGKFHYFFFLTPSLMGMYARFLVLWVDYRWIWYDVSWIQILLEKISSIFSIFWSLF